MRISQGISLLIAITALVPALATGPAVSAPDTVAECRAEHADNPAAYVRCLEVALAARESGRDDQDGEAAAEAKEHASAFDLGAEQVAAAGDDEVSLRIVHTSYSARGLGTFHMDNGQVWRETTPSPERKRLDPERHYEARIVRGKIGGYRMHVDGVRWMKTVERIE